MLLDEPMSRHTTFKVGGAARYFLVPYDEASLAKALRHCDENGIHRFIIGRGSNLLVPDEGYDGAVIMLHHRLGEIFRTGESTLYAGAGAALSRLCRVAYNLSLSGLAFAFGIPGTVGGAVYMNAGAYGGEMADVITEASHIGDGYEKGTLKRPDMALSYRHSAYTDNGFVITGASFELRKGDKNEILSAMNDVIAKRYGKQPMELGSAGSTFKRPAGSYASALIDQCGLKGERIGGAMVSEKHAGFIVNTGTATCSDILALMERVQTVVFDMTGYKLEPEVKILM